MPISMGAMHMSNNKNYEVQRTNNFELVIDGMSQTFSLSVQGTPIPTTTNEVIELAYGNAKVKVAGQATFEDLEITCLDFITADIEAEINEWRKLVYDPATDKIGWAENYKKNGFLYQYAPDGTHVRSYKIIGCWPTSFAPGEFNQDGSDKKMMTLTISVDKCFPIRD